MTTSLAPLAVQRFVDNNGNALSGGKLFTYLAGTTTKQATYTDSTGSVPNANPVVLNSRGEAQVWLTQNVAYKFTLSPSTDTDPPTNSFWTVDNIQPLIGSIASGGLMGNSSGVPAIPTPQTIGTGLSLANGALSLIPFNYLSGLILSNDSITPNTVLDVAAGFCVDSTNTVAMTLSAMTKSISGPWVAGSGNAGMGIGLVATSITWYHVYAIINSGSPDIYFDTSATASHAPPGTTAFRRIGSIVLDASSHITPFVQFGDDFYYFTEILSLNSRVLTTSPTPFPVSVPLGISVTAMLRAEGTASAPWNIYIVPPFLTALSIPQVAALSGQASQFPSGQFFIKTDTAQNVKIWSDQSSATISVVTTGWFDTRGK